MNGELRETTTAPLVAQPDIRVLLFGSLRGRLGTEVHVTATDGTVGDVWDAVVQRGADHTLSRDGLRCARNLEYCSWDEPVQPGDELAFMPPVCGGSVDDDAVTVALSEGPIDAGELVDGAGRDEDGAVACFVGRVRNHSDGDVVHRLEYEAYAPMALATMRGIAEDARARQGLTTVLIVHRVGDLAVGDVAVLVLTTSAHRDAALDACREIIEAVKADVPIWKREHTARGARWIDARSSYGAHV